MDTYEVQIAALAEHTPALEAFLAELLKRRRHPELTGLFFTVFPDESGDGRLCVSLYTGGAHQRPGTDWPPDLLRPQDYWDVLSPVRLPSAKMAPSVRPDYVKEEHWEDWRFGELSLAVSSVMQAKIEWIEAAWNAVGGREFVLEAEVTGDDEWLVHTVDLAPHDQRLARWAPIDVSGIEHYTYSFDVAGGHFSWTLRSAAPLEPPAHHTRDTDTARFVAELGHIGRPIEDAVTRAQWSNEHGAWTFASIRTKRKKTRRHYARIDLQTTPMAEAEA